MDTSNSHLFVFERYQLTQGSVPILVVCNFADRPQQLELSEIPGWSQHHQGRLVDVLTGKAPEQFGSSLVIPDYGYYWLSHV